MQGSLWNVGMKVDDLEAEVRYFVELGARLLVRESLERPDGPVEYALLEFAGTRLFLTPKPIFEDALGQRLTAGLTHVVIEVQDFEREFRRLQAAGTTVLVGPLE